MGGSSWQGQEPGISKKGKRSAKCGMNLLIEESRSTEGVSMGVMSSSLEGVAGSKAEGVDGGSEGGRGAAIGDGGLNNGCWGSNRGL